MSTKKLVFICAAGLILNLAGYTAANVFNWPFYFDTSGTILIAVLGGYVPGIALGFLTKFFESFFVSTEMYHCSVSILVAIFVAYFARKDQYFKRLDYTLLLVLPLAFLTGAYDLLIDDFLKATNFLHTIRVFTLSFTENFLRELFDKGVMLSLAYLLLQSVPPQVKEAFRDWGQKQAPLSEEMRTNLKMEDYLSSSLRNKLLAILILSSLFVSFSIAIISYLLFRESVIDDRIKIADGVVTMMMNEINPERVDDFLKLGHAAPGYKATEERLYKIKNSNRAVEYLYVYKFDKDGCHVIFDLDSGNVEGDKPGEIISIDEDLEPYLEDLIAGKPIPPIISSGEYGLLLTLCKPSYDVKGNAPFYVSVDYSMSILAEYMRNFVIKLVALFIGCFIFIFVVGFVFIENHIILPVNTMAYCAKNFSYDNTEERKKNIEMVKSLQIKTGDEVENLYTALIRSAENIATYLENLQLAKIQVENMRVRVFAMDELANTDSLTGIRNKTAYSTMMMKLDQKIEDGNAQFCIVMIDVNFLKKVNDTYGHERGNEYLINACRLVCSVFGEEHVYRIGGDEFVVIVDGDKVSLCRYFVNQFKAEMNRKNTNALLEPWERISAAVGVAYYDSEVDKNADEVFKRADKQMYENKIAMKAQRTD